VRERGGKAARAARPRAPRRVGARPRLPAGTFEDQLARCAAALETALAAQDLSLFYAAFRASDLPFLLGHHVDAPRGLARGCFGVIHRLGSISPAVALAVENHYYLSSALALFPSLGDPALDARRRALVRSIVDDRLLVANTNSRVHTDQVGSLGSTARREEGGFRISGSAAFMSLASEGDLVFYFTQVETEGPAFFVAPLRGNPEIEVGPLLFPDAMVDSDTRRVTFRELLLPSESALLVGKSEEMARLNAYQAAWHHTLIVAPFLGAAARALEEARRFLRAVRGPNGQTLAELDGMVLDMGRMAILYRAACTLAHRACLALDEAAVGRAELPELTDAFDLACASKQFGARCAEEVVTEVRRIVGARAFTGAHVLERLSREVMFGPLGGEVQAFIERRYGRRLLGGDDFMHNRW
jgi:alkylation response protein AidB-like acyl-CoA dehydrogenase